MLPILVLPSACADTPEEQWTHANQGIYDAAVSKDGKYALVATVKVLICF